MISSMPSDPDPSTLDTLVLIEQHRAGNREALDELFRRYAGRVQRIVRIRMGAFLRSRAEVEDVVQETLLQAFQGLENFEKREDARLIDWMARIAENSLRKLFEHESAQKRDARRAIPIESLRDRAEASSLAWDLAGTSTAPPEKLDEKEMEEIVDACLAELPEEQREIILLVDFANGDWDFVTEHTGRPNVAAAQTYHRRARIALASKVERRLRS